MVAIRSFINFQNGFPLALFCVVISFKVAARPPVYGKVIDLPRICLEVNYFRMSPTI